MERKLNVLTLRLAYGEIEMLLTKRCAKGIPNTVKGQPYPEDLAEIEAWAAFSRLQPV